MPRTSFLLRLDPRVLDALKRWADDELRSVNGQVDYILQTAGGSRVQSYLRRYADEVWSDDPFILYKVRKQ